MSFLISPGDPKTLAEVLVFIDKFDEDHIKFNAANDDDANDCFKQSHKRQRNSGDDAEHTWPSTNELAKSRRSNAWYSARYRSKKKSEVSEVREQIAALEMQLEQLQRAAGSKGECSSLTDKDTQLSIRWLEEATNQELRRKKAEELNAQLKRLLVLLTKSSAALQSVVQNLQIVRSEANTVVVCPSASPMGLSLSDNEATPQLDELRSSMTQMYSDAQVMFASGAAIDDEASFQSQIKSTSVKLSSSTPMAYGFDTARSMLWNGMQIRHSRCCKQRVQRVLENADSAVKSYVVSVREQELHGVTFVRKFEERGRVLYMWGSAVLPPQDGGKTSTDNNSWRLRFREKGWAMLSRATSNPDHKSVFKISYEAFSEQQDDEQQKASDPVGAFCSCVVGVLSSTLRSYHHQVQSKGIDSLSRNLRAG